MKKKAAILPLREIISNSSPRIQARVGSSPCRGGDARSGTDRKLPDAAGPEPGYRMLSGCGAENRFSLFSRTLFHIICYLHDNQIIRFTVHRHTICLSNLYFICVLLQYSQSEYDSDRGTCSVLGTDGRSFSFRFSGFAEIRWSTQGGPAVFDPADEVHFLQGVHPSDRLVMWETPARCIQTAAGCR